MGTAENTVEVTDRLAKLRKLAERLPSKLNSDWDGTNHFELQDMGGGKDFWWLDMSSFVYGMDENPCESEEGKRLGLIMDIAAEVGRLRDEGVI